jgi:hypothetical protein
MACAALLLPALAAGETPADFAGHAPIELAGDGPYFRLTLPIAVHLAAHSPSLDDVRVFDGTGAAVPFSLIRDRARTERAEQQTPVRWFPLDTADATPDALRGVKIERRADGTIVSVLDGEPPAGAVPKRRGYLLDTSQTAGSAVRLELDWDPSVSGFQQLSVDASDDLQSWRRWADAAQLARLDYNGEHVERREITLPGGHAGYLRLTWAVPEEAPMLTAALLVTSSAAARPAALVWTAPAPPDLTDPKFYEWHYARPIPIERLQLALPAVNVLAPIEIASRDDAESPPVWHVLARSVVYRLAIGGQEWLQQELTLPGTPVSALRLTADPRSGGFGGVPSLSAAVTAQDLVFLARGAGPFTLAVGRDDAQPAGLAPATLMPGYGTATAPPIAAAQLGPLTSRAAAGPERQSESWQGIVLWGVLLLGVGMVGVLAAQLLRQSKA